MVTVLTVWEVCVSLEKQRDDVYGGAVLIKRETIEIMSGNKKKKNKTINDFSWQINEVFFEGNQRKIEGKALL